MGRRIAEKPVADEIISLEKASRPTPVIVLSPFEDLSEMIAALDCGAQGYIPACLGIEAMLTAVRLSAEGAVFMTTATILAMRSSIASQRAPSPAGPSRGLEAADKQFTARQSAVAERLRRGKPNKVIAYELNMCESTVKVHIRNIMKKLRATNRTEAGFKLNALISESERNAVAGDAGPTAASPAYGRDGTEADSLARAAVS
jgi:DNA-binding NarL/FixJ family response regulator